MGREFVQFAKYQPISDEQLYNEEFVDSVGEASQMVNNALALYAQCGRNQGFVLANYPTDGDERDIVLEIPANSHKNVLFLVPEGMLTGAGGKAKFWYYSKADAAVACYAHAHVGRNSGTLSYTESTSFGWHSIEIDCDVVQQVNLLNGWGLRLWFETGGTAITITIRSLSFFEKGKPGTPAYVDLSSSIIGTPDYPYDAAMCKLLNDNMRACYGHRMPRTVLAQCMTNRVKSITSSYDADKRGLANFMINKPQGMTSIEGRLLIGRDAGTARFYIGAYTTAGVEVAYDEIDKADAIAWEDFEITGLSSDETEYEIRIDAKEQVATSTEAYLFNTFACAALSGSDSVALPTKTRVQVDDDVLAQDWDRVNDLVAQVWTRHRQILINQEHWTTSKRDGDYPILDSGMAYPTYGARYLHCRAWISLPTREWSGKLDYDGQTGNFAEGETITTDSASGVVAYDVDDGASGSLYLNNIVGEFMDNDRIAGSVAGVAYVNGTLDKNPDDVQVFVKFSVQLDNSAPVYTETEIFTDERELSGKWGFGTYVDLRVPIPSEYWNDYDDHGGWPLTYKLKCKTDIQDSETSYGKFDQVVLHHAMYWEEVEPVLSEVGL